MLAGFMSVTPPAHAGSTQPARAGSYDDVRTVARVDLDRYAGAWFEIARFPNRFQEKCAGDVQARYARRPDGRIDVVNVCRLADGSIDEARGVARVVDERTSAKLKVRFAPAFLSFLPMVWGDYWVIALDPAYQWAVVGEPERRYLWMLARTPTVPADLFARMRQAAERQGYRLDALKSSGDTVEGG